MDRSLTARGERRVHARSPLAPEHGHDGARLRTGSPLRVLNTSPDGMLVESPARLQPGRQVDVVLQSGATQVQSPWIVVHSRVGCISGGSHLRYRAGLRRAAGSSYSRGYEREGNGNKLPATDQTRQPSPAPNTAPVPLLADGIQFGGQERS